VSSPGAEQEPSRRDVRWNFGCAVIDAAGWGVGMGLVSHVTILPLFVRHLTDSDLAVGSIQAVMHFGWLAPGILVSNWVERLPRVKASVLWIAALERLMLLLLAGLSLWLGPRHPQVLLVAFFGCWIVMNMAMGANMPGYYKLIAKTIPPTLRGRLYGVGGALSGLLGLGAAALAGWFLRSWGFPGAFAACFFGAFVLHTLSVLPLAFMREAAQPEHAAPARQGVWAAVRAGRRDPRLMAVVGAAVGYSVSQAAPAFYTVYALSRFRADEAAVAVFTGVVMGAKMLAFVLAGWMGDHYGNRAAMLMACGAGALSAALAWGGPDVTWLYAAFVLSEVAAQGWGVCASNYVLELCPPERAGTYTAVYGALTGPVRVALPLLGGALVAPLGFSGLFAVATLGGLVALATVLLRVPEPRRVAAPALPSQP
jgi:MFS family permease